MKKYVAIYVAPTEALDAMMENMSDEDAKKGMDDWTQWAKQHEAAIVDLGAPLGKNKRVNRDGAIDERNGICGYTIVQAESHEAATQVFTNSPHLDMAGAYVEVLEWVDMPTE